MTDTLVGTKLFGRSLKLAIGVPNSPTQNVDVEFNDTNATGIDVSGFDVDFTVDKTLKPEPNTCDVTIYNLSESSRNKMSGAKKLTVKLEAGYQGGTTLLYLGEVRAAWTERSGPDFITHIESGDGEKEIAKARLNVPLGVKVPLAAALQAAAKALGVGTGNLNQVAAQLASKGVASLNGGSLTGHAASRLTDVCRSAGLEWSVQNGALQFLDIGKPLTTTRAIEISSDTGMVESPTVDSDGILSFKTLIIPGLQPGVLVNMNSLFFKGGYRVQRCKWTGSVAGMDWHCVCEAKKY